jgi:hypothetical protein
MRRTKPLPDPLRHPENGRDTPGLQDLPECGKLMWFNILRAQALRVTVLAVHSDLAGPRAAEHTKLQLESFLSCARVRNRAGLTEEQRCANHTVRGCGIRTGCRMYTGEKRNLWRPRRSASG